jgi:hypothetical protein
MTELLGRRLARTSGAPRAPARRRLRIGVIALSGLTVLGLLLAIWGFLIEPGLLLVRHVTIETAKWPAALPPLRIVALADIHAGAPHVDEAKLDRIVAEVNAQNPDVVLLLGDYVIQHVLFGTPMPPDTIASHLAGLRAKHGVFAVLGNHDWYDGGKRVWRALENVGIRVLENSAVPLPGSEDRIWLAGIADDSTRHPHPAGTFRPIPEGAAVVALTHDPCRLSGRTGAGRPDRGRSHARRAGLHPILGSALHSRPFAAPLRVRAHRRKRQRPLRHQRDRHDGTAGAVQRSAGNRRHHPARADSVVEKQNRTSVELPAHLTEWSPAEFSLQSEGTATPASMKPMLRVRHAFPQNRRNGASVLSATL